MVEELILDKKLFNALQEYMVSMDVSTNTYRTYSYVLHKLFKENETLSQGNIIKIISKKNRNGKLRYSNSSQRAVFRLINNYCLTNNIDFSLKLTPSKAVERKLENIPTKEEIERLVAATPKPYDLMLKVIYGFGAGLRISEFVKLSWSTKYIDWKKWLINKGDSKCFIRESKRGVSRWVTIDADLMNELYEYAKETVGVNEYLLPNSEGFMFNFDRDTFRPKLYLLDKQKWGVEYIRYVQRWLDYHILNKIGRKVLGRKIHLHQLRHSRASYLYNYENKGIEFIQELLGHKNMNTTRIYVKIDFDKIAKEMKGVKGIK